VRLSKLHVTWHQSMRHKRTLPRLNAVCFSYSGHVAQRSDMTSEVRKLFNRTSKGLEIIAAARAGAILHFRSRSKTVALGTMRERKPVNLAPRPEGGLS
jgi:hypothetical protein